MGFRLSLRSGLAATVREIAMVVARVNVVVRGTVSAARFMVTVIVMAVLPLVTALVLVNFVYAYV